MRMLVEKDPSNMGDVYQMATYTILILISAVIMVVWLKRRGRRNKK
ncbi:hypothetical protein [Cohnella herbarum]|uniref:Uncharacterized protein n=1 Tax=Cohnella herbarum TaxID=2728023 RepID=A0A7Z2VEJ5_9BACL|nr:hypothetical protein [Cohnella herbarum]QJD81716.1 hypothetical protein HH215_11835 [Cohnella herbarum]